MAKSFVFTYLLEILTQREIQYSQIFGLNFPTTLFCRKI